ncbi:isoaspartyl peptidase/L-asparaginase family protein [Pseudoalteromonas sp. SG44-8]|uniref:isoaspartyl peptidase/L-asparaginase family protein n=1 Tax=Pseudoalteromonas sp. SG44-8 TaxID=2760958 RepID=UPI0016040C4E|nr:N(4)-(beta-N-acetylglucosaminyl)-L-asparaginase [Pseudoalteromonas sp. SG44-8]MBB1396472.1 N(4)-(beta-N-acetylglucosaminyl)-L-asparaginase [Pseudoalteromonas sp. SG44-8]
MSSKRQFLRQSITAVLAVGASTLTAKVLAQTQVVNKSIKSLNSQLKPIVVSTWQHGIAANKAAWQVLAEHGKAIDAVEAGVRIPEADPNVMTVGYGGYPDREGNVTLDACIMDENQNCGAVAFLQHIKHPISVARLVMDNTPHVMLVGEGALQFAKSQGFIEENLLTPQAKKAWQDWLVESKYAPVINIENHDTIGMLALDSSGDLSGACTTSGAAFKMSGRVGDSPIIGAGLYVDNEVGAATATGMGELMIKTVGCHLVVEMMRQGMTPTQACKAAVERIAHKLGDYKQFQVGFLALSKSGEYGSYCIQPGFNYAVTSKAGSKLLDSASIL